MKYVLLLTVLLTSAVHAPAQRIHLSEGKSFSYHFTTLWPAEPDFGAAPFGISSEVRILNLSNDSHHYENAN
jgi:hypothetical protein